MQTVTKRQAKRFLIESEKDIDTILHLPDYNFTHAEKDKLAEALKVVIRKKKIILMYK